MLLVFKTKTIISLKVSTKWSSCIWSSSCLMLIGAPHRTWIIFLETVFLCPFKDSRLEKKSALVGGVFLEGLGTWKECSGLDSSGSQAICLEVSPLPPFLAEHFRRGGEAGPSPQIMPWGAVIQQAGNISRQPFPLKEPKGKELPRGEGDVG